jgi:hypothetical protein
MDVTIREFMRCLFKSEYEILTISGTPPMKVLCDAWDNLYEDYAKAIGNQQYQRLMRAMREYIRLTGKLMSAEAGLTILQMRRDEEAIDGIHALGYNLEFSAKDRKAYDRDMHVLMSHCKTIRAKISVQADEIEKIKNENANEKQATEQDFISGIAVISKHMGFRIDITTCSMGEYAEYQRQYNDYVTRENAKNKNNG